jgi:hypothetical protein
MTTTLRIVNVQVTSISSISATFTENLTPNLVPANVSIISQTAGAPDAQALIVSVSEATINIISQPLTPLAVYSLQFQSVPQYPFQSVNGDAVIASNGIANVILITAPQSPDNPVANYLSTFYNGSIYDAMQNPNSVVSNYINSLSTNLARALYDIGQLKNENYLELDIVDEQHVRGAGPFDRLLQEGAYEVSRVGINPTNAALTAAISYTNFPSFEVTLQGQNVAETLTANSMDEVGFFNIDDLILNLSNFPVTILNSVVFTLGTNNPIYTYNIATLGYQIQSSVYDQNYGFTSPDLANNQIRLSDQILSDPLFSLDSIISIQVSYQYQNLGVIVNPNTVTVTTPMQSIREVLPPIINIFDLQHAPIINGSGEVPTLGGVVFTDPNQATPGALHPAFLQEIPFSLSALPFTPGVYSINYEVGQVYVYGASLTNDGTGPYPPLATYTYLLTYQSEIDYAFDDTSSNLAALPNGNLIGNAGTINFNYEQVLIPGTDYIADIHIESLQERINNNLSALNVLTVQNAPITNVFQIFNETTGEIYTLTRWYNNQVYFQYINPPNIVSVTGEQVTFNQIVNELLFLRTTFTNSNNLRIFQIYLANNTLVAGTEDTTASSFNTSLTFTDGNVFVKEIWYSREFDSEVNTNRLQSIGEYMVDYLNGIVYVAVSDTQNQFVGTVIYRNDQIDPQFPHVLSVEDIYYRISPLLPKNAEFAYTSFSDGAIVPAVLNPSDELYLNGNTGAPYQLYNGSVGVFMSAGFVPGVTYQVKFVRSIFEYDDLLNSTNPINFAIASISNNFNITVGSLISQSISTIQFDGTNFYVLININVPYLSPNIQFVFSVIRNSDRAQLWNTNGTIVPGNPLKLILPGINSPHVGDNVVAGYNFTINNISRLVVDYNKGNFYVDYTYLADEILVSYEYGDNYLDFRQSLALSTNDIYYVSYKAGALRDALLKNFGTLVNIPELSNVDLTFDRQRYREALQAALSSFIQGPTVAAIKNIGYIISHVEPQVIESAFESWTLGQGLLNPQPITTTGNFQLLPAKFGNGVLINEPYQSIKFPAGSNLRLEEGTFETWIIPQWNGLDNDAELTFTITQDGYNISPGEIFIGAAGYHPTVINGNFSINKNSNAGGIPNTNKDGVFIYYNNDPYGNFSRWYLRVIDGYVEPSHLYPSYKIVIQAAGHIYDNKSLIYPKPSNMSFFTGTSSITLNIADGYGGIDYGLTFLADPDHYIFDTGKETSRSRLSIYKDASGYINLRAIGTDRKVYTVSADVSSWQAGDPHFVAASWQLNTINNQDQLHLFLDGFEVPNIIKYGQKLQPYLHERFRTVDPEEVVGSVSRDIVGSTDLTTTAGSNIVTSSLNFSSFHIFIGDLIFINEVGFSPNGYTITSINGQTLTLNALMPLSLPGNGRYSINQTSFTLQSNINVPPNITVSTIHYTVEGFDITGISGSNLVTSASTNFTTAGIVPGYSIRIDNDALNITYTIWQVLGNTLMIDAPLPINISPTEFQVYSHTENELPGQRALFPDYSVSQDGYYNSVLTISNGVFAGDLILVRTLGLNYRNVQQQYYVWSTETENIIMSRLPPPISLDETDITKIILPLTAIGPNNSTVVAGQFVSNNLPGAHPSNSQSGRTISVTIAGGVTAASNNVNFSSPVQVTINGMTSTFITVSETLSFTEFETLTFTNQYITVNYLNVKVTPYNTSKNALTVTAFEQFPITISQNSGLVPVIRYSYIIGGGNTLFNDSPTSVRDNNNTFSGYDIGNYLLIQSPVSVAGFYLITGVSPDLHSVFIQSTPAAFKMPLTNFTNGTYQLLNVTQYRSGLQNGFFILEPSVLPGEAYYLSKGFYQLNYSTYMSIKFDPLNGYCYFGSDIFGNNQAGAILNQVKIYSTMLTDTRIGESIPASQHSITKDYNSLKPLTADSTTLALITFNSEPFTNSAPMYVTLPSNPPLFQSNYMVNDNFGESIVLSKTPIIVPNAGILDTTRAGTIEFWCAPLLDTNNDPNTRTYFDAYGATLVNAISVNDVSVKITAPASQILSVRLQTEPNGIDYFAGGKLEIDTQRAIQETTISLNANTVVVSQFILQVITVKIVGDFTGRDYFANGSIGTDGKTIYLGLTLPQPNLPLIVTYQSTANLNNTLNTQVIRLNRKLPNQNTPVIVNYIPQGLQGDRIQIFKDPYGYINFIITASGQEFSIRAPTYWSRYTWHRIKAQYTVNGGLGQDQMLLFLDGYQWSDQRFGNSMNPFSILVGGAQPGDGYADGYNNNILTNIIFKDPINDLFIGTDYTGSNSAFSLVSNFRISNQFRPVYAPYGEALDVNYTSNLSVAFPVTQDLYTTYLLNFEALTTLNTNFATIKNKKTGNYDFTVNIEDVFGIVASSVDVSNTLNTLINTLKPATSIAIINVIE